MEELFLASIMKPAELIKSSRNKKDLNDITAAPFFVVSFSAASSKKRTIKNGAAISPLLIKVLPLS